MIGGLIPLPSPLPGSEDLWLPEEPWEEYYLDSYANKGARISSNSWGDMTGYDDWANEIDDFTYSYPDYLFVFAGGNDGDTCVRVRVLCPLDYRILVQPPTNPPLIRTQR